MFIVLSFLERTCAMFLGGSYRCYASRRRPDLERATTIPISVSDAKASSLPWPPPPSLSRDSRAPQTITLPRHIQRHPGDPPRRRRQQEQGRRRRIIRLAQAPQRKRRQHGAALPRAIMPGRKHCSVKNVDVRLLSRLERQSCSLISPSGWPARAAAGVPDRGDHGLDRRLVATVDGHFRAAGGPSIVAAPMPREPPVTSATFAGRDRGRSWMNGSSWPALRCRERRSRSRRGYTQFIVFR